MIRRAIEVFIGVSIAGVVLSLVILGIRCVVSWGDCEEGEIWFEAFEAEPNVYVEVVHTKGCPLSKPYFEPRFKIDKEFSKRKNTVFDYCVDDELELIINAVSYRYNKRYIEWAWIYDETKEDADRTNKRIESMDTTFSIRTCMYGFSGGRLVRLKEDVEILIGRRFGDALMGEISEGYDKTNSLTQ